LIGVATDLHHLVFTHAVLLHQASRGVGTICG
jgi:hypothetical protein